jgi:uncharacterized membrane protein
MGDTARRGHPVPWTWWPAAVLAFLIALYGLSFYLRGEAAFPNELSESFKARPWGIYTHVLFGPLALAIGPFQLRRDLMLRRRSLHRRLGVVYVVSAAATGAVGTYMAAYSYGGLVTHLGFGLLALATLTAALKAYASIREYDVAAHREWMIRSYALIFAAVTLRLELPFLAAALGGFRPGYQVVAWLSWVPNLVVAERYVRRTRAAVATGLPRHSRAAI